MLAHFRVMRLNMLCSYISLIVTFRLSPTGESVFLSSSFIPPPTSTNTKEGTGTKM